MIREFTLPDVGEGVAEGELVSWLVAPGDAVSEDQPVAEVETDKALVEVPSPYDGTVHELHAEEGEIVPVGDVLLSFDVPTEGEGDDGEPGDAGDGEVDETDEAERGGSASPVAPPSVRRLARELGVDLGGVAGSGPGGRVTEGDVRAAADGEAADDGATDAPTPRAVGPEESTPAIRRRDGAADEAAEAEPTPAPGETVEAADRDRTLAAPATRRVAEEAGVDIDAVPTDERRDGEAFVTPEQVRAFAAARAGSTGAETPARAGTSGTAEPTATATPDETADGPSGERVPYRGVRRAIGEQMERAKFTAPHATHHDVADASALVEVREDLNEVTDVRLTYLPFVMKAVVSGLREYPYVNAQLDADREEIILRDEYNVGVATATDAGLMVPVVDDVDDKGLAAVAREVRDLAERARDRSIAPEEMQGGTFTVTNVGAIGGEYATPIVNHPEVAILALGAIRDRPRAVDGEVVARKTLPLSLSVDHRVVDGAVAARFTNHVVDRLEHPERLLLE